MKILCDRHHSDLTYSLHRLFEDRLGVELFVPVGLDWWLSKYWRFGEAYGDDRLARQFLAINDTYREVEPGLFLTFDPFHPERPLYGVAIETARNMSWDFILATVQENQEGFQRFAIEIGADYLCQVGNANQYIDWSLNPMVLNSANSPIEEGRGVHIGQEFDHLTTFRYRPPKRLNRITSFVNLLALIPQSQTPFEELSKLLPSHEFKSYGHECPDGFLKPVAAVAEEMSRSSWAYHDKPTGDGFGHCIHNWAAVGRPLIGHARYYKDQRAEPFWQDGITCIDLDKHSIEEAAQIVLSTTPDRHEQMCKAIRKALEETYDPEEDAETVKRFLSIDF